jgi:hypothetical protein
MAAIILCPHPFIKPVYTSTGINPEPYSNRGVCKYSYIIPDAMMPGIVPPQIYKGSSGSIQVDGYVSRYFCPPQKMPTTRDEFLSMENTGRLLSELQECPVPCPVELLKPITDPDVLRFENGDNVRIDKLDPEIQKKLQCFQSSGVSLTVTSAWRPQGYQDHFYEIYTKLILLDKPESKNSSACNSVRNQIQAEANRHGIANLLPDGSRKRVAENSNHKNGDAFDASWTVSDSKMTASAKSCGLCHPIPFKDRPHFQVCK